MNMGKLVFAQIMEHLPRTTFGRCVARYGPCGGKRYSDYGASRQRPLRYRTAQKKYVRSVSP
jgi:hypothetical protein